MTGASHERHHAHDRSDRANTIPDSVVRLGIAALCERTNRKLAAASATANRDFAVATASLPIAEHVDDANTQHYEVPPAFFEKVLGPQRKYSCCLFRSRDDDLAAAEDHALAEAAAHAELADAQAILELGWVGARCHCGWRGIIRLRASSRSPIRTRSATLLRPGRKPKA